MAYSDKLVDHFENPRNMGAMDKSDPSVGTGLVGAPACGDVMKLQLKISDDGIMILMYLINLVAWHLLYR